MKEDASNREITISRLLNAPRELVWKVWTEPEHIKNWWGPNGFTTTIFKMDVQAGGEWDLILHGPDGTDYKNKSVFEEIIKPEKIVYNHVSSPKFKATVTFEAQGDKTLLNWQMLFETAEEFEQTVKAFKADEGLKQNVEKLEQYVLNFQSTILNSEPIVIERTYNAHVSKVWKAITDNDAMKKWYFDIPEFKAEVGFEFVFIAGNDDKKYVHTCVVKEVIPFKKLSYSWRYKDYEGNSLVTFELFDEGEKTKVKLTHVGLETFPQNLSDFEKRSFNEGWNFILGTSLKGFVEL